MKNPIHLLVWLALTIVSLPLKADWGDPSGFFDKEKIKEEELHPGVVWWSIDGELKGKPEKINLITVDLEKTDLKPKVLLGERFVSLKNGQRFRRSFVSQLHADNDVVAAINVSFFDIGATQAPSGLTMQDGMIYLEPSTSGRICLVFSPDGRAALAEPKWKAEIEIGGRKRPLGGINKPGLAKDEVVLYQTPWAESPGNSTPFSKDLKIREIVVEKTGFQPAAKSSDRSKLNGQVLEIRDLKKGVEIGENQFVLTASESAAPFFRHLRPGQEVTISWELTDMPAGFEWHKVREIVSSFPLLVENGKAKSSQSALWTTAHPRSAIGISQDQKKLAIVLIDGRWKESAGISLGDLADFLIHLGSHNALNFDGGGSSALAATIRGKTELLNRPSSNGNERYVPTGLGIEIIESAALAGSRTWTGANGREIRGVFQNFDRSTGNVTLISNGRRYTFPISSLSQADRELIERADSN